MQNPGKGKVIYSEKHQISSCLWGRGGNPLGKGVRELSGVIRKPLHLDRGLLPRCECVCPSSAYICVMGVDFSVFAKFI